MQCETCYYNILHYLSIRGYLSYALALVFISIAVFMVLTKYFSQGRAAHEVKVIAPPPMNTVEQLLAVQTAISQAEGFIQDGNIVLLKLRALLMSIYPRVRFHFFKF